MFFFQQSFVKFVKKLIMYIVFEVVQWVVIFQLGIWLISSKRKARKELIQLGDRIKNNRNTIENNSTKIGMVNKRVSNKIFNKQQ